MRRNLIASQNTPELVKETFKSSEFGEWLFGDGIIERIKSTKVSEATLKPIGEKKSGVLEKKSQAPKNYKGPPRAGKAYRCPQNNLPKSSSKKPNDLAGKNKRRSGNKSRQTQHRYKRSY